MFVPIVKEEGLEMGTSTSPAQVDSLSQYFDLFGDRYFCVWSKKPVGSASVRYRYCKIEDFSQRIWKETGVCSVDYAPIEYFEYNLEDNSCTFSIGTTHFHLSFSGEATDKWGNTATYEDGVEWKDPGCLEVHYSDSSLEQFHCDFEFSTFILDNDLEGQHPALKSRGFML